jgi:hypothetical protein
MDIEVRELTQAEALSELAKAQADLQTFKIAVADKAMELAREHDWCSVVTVALEDLGLGDLIPVDRTGERRHIRLLLDEVTLYVDADCSDGTVEQSTVDDAVRLWVRNNMGSEHWSYADEA